MFTLVVHYSHEKSSRGQWYYHVAKEEYNQSERRDNDYVMSPKNSAEKKEVILSWIKDPSGKVMSKGRDGQDNVSSHVRRTLLQEVTPQSGSKSS